MTSRASSLPVPAPSDGPPIQVSTEGLLAAVPVLLGFRPRDSLVVAATGGPGGRRIGLTLRVDLPPPEDDEMVLALARAVATTVARDDPSGAAVVVVGGGTGPDDGDGGAAPGRAGGGAVPGGEEELPPRADVVAATALALSDLGVEVHTAAWVEEIAAGARWRCYPLHGCACSGILPDPTGTVLAATAAMRGSVVYPSREELARVVAPADPAQADLTPGEPNRGGRTPVESAPGGCGADSELDCSCGGVEPEDAAPADRVVPERPIPDRGGRAIWPKDAVAALRAALADAARGRLTVDAELVRIMSGALRRRPFREIALSTCVGPDAAAAEQLWAALARTCRGPIAADPAALLAICALARGDGALANLALDRAEGVRPEHRLTRDLRTAIAAGWGPTEIRTWLEGEA